MGSLRLAIACDEAFCFYYQENIRELERAGFEVVCFSPLRDKELPVDISGIYIGGGYPELHAKKLAENKSMLVDIKRKVGFGMPIIAECGGFMYLMNSVDIRSEHDSFHNNETVNSGASSQGGADGYVVSQHSPETDSPVVEDAIKTKYEMCSIFQTECEKKDRLVRFGYVEVFDKTGLWLDPAMGIRGHEFHYYEAGDNGDSANIVKASTGDTYKGIHITDTIWAGWPHLYFRSNTEFARVFAVKCERYRTIAELC